MNYLARVASTALAIVFVAGADTTPKRSADPNTTTTPSSRSTLGFSPWRAIYLQRNGTVDWRKRKDFNDLRFEYRWKSESSVIRQDCTVEIRPSEDVDVTDTIPTITVAYIDPHGHPHTPPWVTKQSRNQPPVARLPSATGLRKGRFGLLAQVAANATSRRFMCPGAPSGDEREFLGGSGDL